MKHVVSGNFGAKTYLKLTTLLFRILMSSSCNEKRRANLDPSATSFLNLDWSLGDVFCPLIVLNQQLALAIEIKDIIHSRCEWTHIENSLNASNAHFVPPLV